MRQTMGSVEPADINPLTLEQKHEHDRERVVSAFGRGPHDENTPIRAKRYKEGCFRHIYRPTIGSKHWPK